MTPSRAAVALVRRVVAALDGRVVGDVYCDYGGAEFWRDRQGPVVDLGLRWAEALCCRLPAAGRSLYVGAGVAELPAMIVESVDLQRAVVACNLRDAECDAINRALAAQGLDLRVGAVDAATSEVTVDHVSLVSVVSDPETFPTLSGLTYGRLHPALVDSAQFAAESQRARALVQAVLGRLSPPGLVTTTVEEVPWVLAWAETSGVVAHADEAMLDTAIVGDPIGFLRVASRPIASQQESGAP